MFKNFFLQVFASSAIGIVGGIVPTILLKYLHKFLEHSDVAEVSVMILCGYSSYLFCEM